MTAQSIDDIERDIVFEATVSDLADAMAMGRTSSVALVDAYLARIAAYDQQGPALNAIIRLDGQARAVAAKRDAERKAGHVRGPLHGIPVLIKDNYCTTDSITSNGTIAFAGLRTPFDAFQVRRIREAGAVILGKTNMHEMASGITNISSIGGQTRNPYDPDRLPGGSSGGSGAAVAASFATLAWGSDTCGSIRIPATVHNLYGLRPTKGLTSTAGIVPLSHSQDVAGPLARCVRDLAIALDISAGEDPDDPATTVLRDMSLPRFVAAIDSAPMSLAGKRFGVLTMLFGNESDDLEGNAIVRAAIETMKGQGAEFVDVTIPTLEETIADAGVIPFEFTGDIGDFLARLPDAPVHTFAEALTLGLYHTQLRETFERRVKLGSRDSGAYVKALALREVAHRFVMECLEANRFDALVYPALRRKPARIGEVQRGNTCQLSAVTGLPALTMPAGFTPDGLPIGIELIGRPFADAELVAMAYTHERATGLRRAPDTTPPLVNSRAPRPVELVARANAGDVVLQGTFMFDVATRRLEYRVEVAGVPGDDVYGVTLVATSEGRREVLYTLLRSGGVSGEGVLTLAYQERRALVAREVELVLYSREAPTGTVRGELVVR